MNVLTDVNSPGRMTMHILSTAPLAPDSYRDVNF